MPLFPLLPMSSFPQRLTKLIDRIPGHIYLWLAIPIFGSSSAVTRKITEIGAQHFVGGHNPISYCNVLFTGNLCALLVLVLLHRHQWHRHTLKQISGMDWFGYCGDLIRRTGSRLDFSSIILNSSDECDSTGSIRAAIDTGIIDLAVAGTTQSLGDAGIVGVAYRR
jgi:hypothetical protein